MPRATRAALGAASDSERTVTRLVALAYILLGAGFFLSGIMQWRRAGQRTLAAADVTVPGRLAPDDAGLGSAYSVSRPGGGGDLGESLEAALQRTKGSIVSQRAMRVGTIEQRVELIRKMVVKGGESPRIREQAAAVLSRKCGAQWCTPPKDYAAEATALFNAVVDPRSPIAVRYTRDHPIVDVFTQAEKTMRLRIGDCDDLTIYLGALLLSVGFIPEMVTIQAKGAGDWSHIFLRVRRDGSDGVTRTRGSYQNPDDYLTLYTDRTPLVLDPSMPNKPAGWAPPGLTEVLRHGGSAGIVQKAKVWPVITR